MNSKVFYIIALLFLPLLRFLVLNTEIDVWLQAAHFDRTAYIITALRTSQTFLNFIGNWGLIAFVVAVLIFWLTEREGIDIPKQFLLLPIIYIPFSIVGAVLTTAEFKMEYLYVHPLIILTFGYVYVLFWAILAWILGKLHIIS